MSQLENRVVLLEHDTQEIFDILDQAQRDLELCSINIQRALHTIGKKTPSTTPQQQPATTAVQELTFTTLKYDLMHGEKIGDYEIAYASANIADKFQTALNILKASNATIKDRYHGVDYQYSYWIYGEGKIYRQKLKRQLQ